MDPLMDLLKVDFSTLTNVLRDILARLRDHEDKIVTLEAANAEKDRQIMLLSEQVRDGNQKIHDMGIRVGLLAARTDEISKETEANSAAVGGLQTTMTDVLERLDRLERAGGLGGASSLDSRLSELEKKTNGLDGMAEQIAELRVKKADREAVDASVSAIEDTLARIQEQLARNGSMLKDQQGALRTLEALANGGGLGSNALTSGADGRSGRDRSSLDNLYVLKAQWDSELGDLQEKDSLAAAEIRKLWQAVRKLKESDDELQEAGAVRDAQISELRQALAALGKLVNAVTDRVNECASRRDLLALRDDLLKQIREAAGALKEHLKKELRRFEKDLIDYVGERGGVAAEQTETAIGKVYFRCLTCNQVTGSQHGPHSKAFQSQMGIPIVGAAGPLPAGALPHKGSSLAAIAQGGMLIERGDDLTLHGADGQVYKGREDPLVHFAAPSDASPPPQLGFGSAAAPAGAGATAGFSSRSGSGTFRVVYAEKDALNTSSSGSMSHRGARPSSSGVYSGMGPGVAYAPAQAAAAGPGVGGSPQRSSLLRQRQQTLSQQFAPEGALMHHQRAASGEVAPAFGTPLAPSPPALSAGADSGGAPAMAPLDFKNAAQMRLNATTQLGSGRGSNAGGAAKKLPPRPSTSTGGR
jgi:hypothetical protein